MNGRAERPASPAPVASIALPAPIAPPGFGRARSFDRAPGFDRARSFDRVAGLDQAPGMHRRPAPECRRARLDARAHDTMTDVLDDRSTPRRPDLEARPVLNAHPVPDAARVGVLALQGDFREHRLALERLGAKVTEVRLPGDLAGLAGVVIPGGESTTMAKLMLDYGLDAALVSYYQAGGSLWGTCAGAITLSKDLVGYSGQPHLGLMDLQIVRNDYGRQVASFEADLTVDGLDAPFRGLFIRAPRIIAVGPDVEVLASYQGDVVAAAQGRLMVTVFHPELVEDDRIHGLFLDRMREAVAAPGTGVPT